MIKLGPSGIEAPSIVVENISVLVGQVNFFAMATPPLGYLKCNGQAISRTVYATLFSAIGTLYGVGDGTTTFNLPDLRGEFIRAMDDGRGVDAARVLGSAQADELKSHTHTYNEKTGWAYAQSAGSHYGNPVSVNSGATGGTETRPRNVALLACIKY